MFYNIMYNDNTVLFDRKKRKKKKKQANILAANPVTFGGGFGREGVCVCINKWHYIGLHLKKKVLYLKRSCLILANFTSF